MNPSQFDCCAYRRILGHRQAQRKVHVKKEGKDSHLQQRREASEEIDPVDTGLPARRIMRKLLCYLSCLFYGTLLGQP